MDNSLSTDMTAIAKAVAVFYLDISRHRIIPMTSPWVAGQYPFDSEIAAFKRTVFGESLYAVLAASGRVAAVAAEMGGDNKLIAPDEDDKRPGKYLAYHTIDH